MKVKIKVLSPIHIWSGEELSPLEYFIENGIFYRLNMDSLFRDKDFAPFSKKFVDSASQVRDINLIVNDKGLLKRNCLYSFPLGPGFEENFQLRKYPLKTFVKSAGRVFIPGSSLKGAILSALTYFVVTRSSENRVFGDNEMLLNLVIGKLSRSETATSSPESLERRSKNKFSRWLDVTDSDLKVPSDVLNLSLARAIGAGSAIPILYETLRPGTEFILELKTSLPGTEFRWGEDLLKILSIVKGFYLKVWKKDQEFFGRLKNRDNSIPIKEIYPPTDQNSYLVRLGQGSTSYSTSLLLAAEERNIPYEIRKAKGHKKGPPITRKLIGGWPMGWASITPISEGKEGD